MSEKENSLKELFSSAKKEQDRLESSEPRSEASKEAHRAAVSALEECRKLIVQLALYSSNESIEDVSTQDLQFLTVDYLLAEILLKSYDDNRIDQLKKVVELIESFLTRLDRYDVLSKTDRRLFERYQDNRQQFSVISTTNAEERRRQKISRFQEEKSLKSQLKLSRDRSMVNHVDDETVRSLYLAELALYVHESFQSLDMISQELTILSHIRRDEPPSRTSESDVDSRQGRQAQESFSERLDGPMTMGGLGRKGGPLLSPSGKPLQPFTLTDKRTRLQKGVFGPSHNLPTMSIDEYLDEERKRGGIIDGGGNADAVQPEPDEDNMEQVDAATMKAREWDEFVEANPKGAGNTLNRG